MDRNYLKYYLKKTALFFVSLVIMLLVFTGCGIIENIGGDEEETKQTFYPTIKVDGVDISGKTVEEAKILIEQANNEAVGSKKIPITLDGNSTELLVSDLQIKYNTDEILSQAIQLGRVGTSSEKKNEQTRLQEQGQEFTTTITLEEVKVQEILNSVTGTLAIAPTDPQASFDTNKKLVVTPSVDGKKVDVESLAKTIIEKIKAKDFSSIEAPFVPVKKEGAEADASSIVLISTYTSSYKSGSYASRVFNINKAAGLLSGSILQPGESLSVNDVLGPRSVSTGWKLAHAILDGGFVDQAGGGVCQVSSTLFNAVMMADLEVTERTPHSWPIGYIPIGRDATISTGGPNLIFKNPYETPIYIVMYTTPKEKTLTAEIWGAPLKDGMTIKVTSKKVGSIGRKGTEYVVDKSLPPNTRVEVKKERSGSRSETYKEYYDKDGNLIEKKLVYKDTYPAIKGLVMISADLAGGGSTATTPSPASTPKLGG